MLSYNYDDILKDMREEKRLFLSEIASLKRQNKMIKNIKHKTTCSINNDTYFLYNGYAGCKREEFNTLLNERGKDFVFYMRANGEFCCYVNDKPMYPFQEENSITHWYYVLSADERSVSSLQGTRITIKREEDCKIEARMNKEQKNICGFLQQLEERNDASIYY